VNASQVGELLLREIALLSNCAKTDADTSAQRLIHGLRGWQSNVVLATA
jgi:hypothetical protein